MGRLFRFLVKNSPGLLVLAVLTSVLTGVINTTLVALLNRTVIQADALPQTGGLLFLGLLLALPLTRAASQIVLAVLSQGAVFELRIQLTRRILASPLRQIEQLGASRFLAALTTDVQTLATAMSNFPYVCMHLAIIISCFAYLHWLYWPAGLSVLVAMAFGGLIYRVATAQARVLFRRARQDNDHLFKHFEALTAGIKELKQSRPRRHDFLTKTLWSTVVSYRKHVVKAHIVFAFASSLGVFIFFAIVGLLVFFMPGYVPALQIDIVSGFVLVLLFVWGPFDRLSTSLPNLAYALVALKQIESLGISLSSINPEPENTDSPQPTWHSLEMLGVTHTYHREREDEIFTMGPIDLAVKPGELIFVVGGNGSGKTTLAKLIIGLYSPECGEIRIDGQPVTDQNRDLYRQHFAVVFNDFYLFGNMEGLDPVRDQDQADGYLEKLHLNHKVQIRDGKLSTVELSQGQRKRLALLTAYLEDRSIYMFDEWAADQDPQFKEIFYRVLLPELKARGKTVFVVSHDDHYFDAADRMIKLDYGKIEFDRPRSQ